MPSNRVKAVLSRYWRWILVGLLLYLVGIAFLLLAGGPQEEPFIYQIF